MTDAQFCLVMLGCIPGLSARHLAWLTDALLSGEIDAARLASGSIGGLAGRGLEPEQLAAVRRGDTVRLAETVIERCARIGAHLVFRGTPNYPGRLEQLESRPAVLYVRGDVACLAESRQAVAVVGTRDASSLGVRFATETAAHLAAAGVVVVSGLALGTDAAAHEGALEVQGATIAVIASGVDQPTPRANAGLAKRIIGSGGAVLSEHPPGTRVGPWSFPERNRIIAGLSAAVVVLEALRKSGTASTARAGIEAGRRVYAMAGRPGDQRTEGALELLRLPEVEVFRGAGELLADLVIEPSPVGDVLLGPHLSDLAELISEHLPCRLETLVSRLEQAEGRVQVPTLIGSLTILKLHRVVHEDEAGMLSLVSPLRERSSRSS